MIPATIRYSIGGGRIFLLFFVRSSFCIDLDLNLTFSFFRIQARDPQSAVMETQGYRQPRQMKTYLIEPIHGAWVDTSSSNHSNPVVKEPTVLYGLRLVLIQKCGVVLEQRIPGRVAHKGKRASTASGEELHLRRSHIERINRFAISLNPPERKRQTPQTQYGILEYWYQLHQVKLRHYRIRVCKMQNAQYCWMSNEKRRVIP